MSNELNNKIKHAAKWSVITEVIAKFITPITSMMLARLLTPEAFGVVATLTMIISFAEIFTDAGFQKFLIQQEFRDEKEREQSTTVAFWSNLSMSLLIWAVIAVFSEPLAVMVGNPGLGHVLVIACISIPLSAFSSIQIALYKRDLDFKTLFKVRIIGICIPLFVTIPLALWLRNYWALVCGTIASNIVNAVLLTYYSTWKPRIYYSFNKFKEMFSFTIWSVVEAVTIWMTGYIDIFFIGIYLNEYYLGLYKMSIATVGSLTSIIISATTPILFSGLSRLQNDNEAFKQMFFKFQKLVGMLIIPLGVGIFCYSDLITAILLGGQWGEASDFIGLWGLSSAFTIVFAHYSSEVYRSKGRPKLSVLAQVLHLVVLLPVVYWSVQYGYGTLIWSRSLVRFELIIVNMIIIYYTVKMSPWRMLINVAPSIIAAIVMGCFAWGISGLMNGIFGQFIGIILSSILFFITVSLFPIERAILIGFVKRLKNNKF